LKAVEAEKMERMNAINAEEAKIGALRDSILHEINERHKVIDILKDSVNHEIRERNAVVRDLVESIAHEKREKDRVESDVRSSLSFKIGWVITFPLRLVHAFVTSLLSGKPWLFLQFFRSAAKNPVKMAKNINRQNIRTLRTALKRENPELIASNLNKLLVDKQKLESAEHKAKLLQKELKVLKKKEQAELHLKKQLLLM